MPEEIPHPSDEEFQIRYFLQKGEEYRKQGSWDFALTEFRRALQLKPRSSEILLHVAQAYQDKGEQEKEPAFLKLAWHHYQDAITQDPSHAAAHDHMIALAVKLKRFDELITDYKQRLNQDKDNPLIAASLRKLQTLSLMSIPEASQGGAGSAGTFSRLFFDILFPIFGVLMLLLGIMVQNYYTRSKLAPYAPTLVTAGWISLGCFALIKFFTYQSAKNRSKQWS